MRETCIIMARRRISFYECGCERCGHKWIPNSLKEPLYCPNCKSQYWNKPRRKPRFSATFPSNKSASLEIKKKKVEVKAPVKLPTRGRGGSFQTAARTDVPKAVRNYIRRAKPPVRKPSQREIDNAGIGGAT
jgi:hypothetical protein